MEDDNAHDLHKFIGSKESNDVGEVTVTWREQTFKAKIILRGNILSISAVEEAQVPLIFVIEKAVVRRSPAEFALILSFASEDDTVLISFDNEKSVESWMVKLATCSHAISRAELDELAYKFFTMGSASSDASTENNASSSFLNYFLANPTSATHAFAIAQANGLPSRRITFEESMWESKLSLLLPTELIKLYRKWTSDFCCLLEPKIHSWPSFAVQHVQEIIRELRDNAETYEQCSEFLATYSGPHFRKSVEKHRVAFGAVPTNLHLQVYGITNSSSRELLTCGTASAFPLRFTNGGLTRLLSSLDVNPAFRDSSFFSRRSGLMDLKRTIGDLSHKLDVEWKMSSFGKPDKVCLEINAGIKQVYEKLKDTFACIPNLEKHLDTVFEEEKRRQSKGQKISPVVSDSLQNQMDNLDAMLISLNTKIAVIDSLDDEQRGFYEKSAREAMSTCLDSLLTLTDSVIEGQLFGLVMSLQKTSTVHQFFHIQIRSDFVFSQAVTIAATAIMSRVQQPWTSGIDGNNDVLLVIFSFLSAYGDEKGMIEDALEAWRLVEAKVEFKFVRAPSSVCRNCIPVLSGSRASLKVSLPLPHDRFDVLPESLKSCDFFRVRPAYFNIGVNHEATLAQSFGGISLESAINQEGAQNLVSFSNRMNCSVESRDTVMELVNAVSTEGSRKNLAVFEWAMAVCEALNGRAVVSCKSGKDRTGMAVTLEQGRVVRETCGLGSSQVTEVIASLRKDGVRRENCRKNVGKALYSFSPFQMHFLPKSFRPPMGTYAQGVAS